MKALYTLLLVCCSWAGLKSQPPAPDFTVTDSHGQQHHLYADYLNQGKTVVIELFFTYCPPCNAMAPLLEPFYQSWGGGNGDVEMISLSTKSDDSSADVAMFEAAYGHTFPGVGADGGSINASLPYRNGTYGLFFGTPTFIVIAPDGSVNYDVRGPNYQATIDSLDAAIAATGAVLPQVSFTAGGTVATKTGAKIPGVAILIAGTADTLAITDSTGHFSFTTLLTPDQPYFLTASRDSNYRNGVTTHDLLLISRHILGIGQFTDPLVLLSCDANHDRQITTLDLIFLRRLILGIDLELQNQQSWLFVNSNYQFLIPSNPFSELYTGNAGKAPFSSQSSGAFNFTGIKVGDPNNTADAEH
ncbi:MAG: redoxin family protein [Phaeodactylibacter sp.]|nr:redoxin family protein [Phaeodactylibacter sp.]MCB9303525.1 redoxin family protein [Lewinellaceae bacterium]HQU57944.1 redoxin family protein [Saprospiraceae bacterium]